MTVKTTTQPCDRCDGTGLMPADGIGIQLREKRNSAGVTGGALAEVMGISAEYLYDLERGNRKWSNDLVANYTEKLEELSSVKA